MSRKNTEPKPLTPGTAIRRMTQAARHLTLAKELEATGALAIKGVPETLEESLSHYARLLLGQKTAAVRNGRPIAYPTTLAAAAEKARDCPPRRGKRADKTAETS